MVLPEVKFQACSNKQVGDSTLSSEWEEITHIAIPSRCRRVRQIARVVALMQLLGTDIAEAIVDVQTADRMHLHIQLAAIEEGIALRVGEDGMRDEG